MLDLPSAKDGPHIEREPQKGSSQIVSDVTFTLAGTTRDREIRAFLEDTLEMWGVDGSVEAGDDGVVAIVRAETGARVWIERCEPATPFRWRVRWRGAGVAPGGARELRPRSCASLVGVLTALRTALEIDRGTPVRIGVSLPSAE